MSSIIASVSSSVSPDTPLWLVIPFGLLLLLIAVMPLAPGRVKQLWERFYAHAAVGLGLVVVAFYLLAMPGGGSMVLHTGQEYLSFICLIGSLFVVAGGIHISVRDRAAPFTNVIFLLAGAALANFIGTTGASMVLIRPWIRMNRIRISAYHIVFFIFVVSNAGGALTPIGDPPLFLGYLRGVPFFWLIGHVWLQWLVTIGLLLAVFYVYDRRSFRHASSSAAAIRESIAPPPPEEVRFEGMPNLLFLAVIIGAVFIPDSLLPHLREPVMVAAAAASFALTSKRVHQANRFTFGPIREVAFLFAGIFATMIPALGYIDQHGQEFGVKKPLTYYLTSGSLSSVLDNAPTYATFLRLAETTVQADHPEAFVGQGPERTEKQVLDVMRNHPTGRDLIVAVSLGAVFFGAMTYIGNGPNFMVKSIADSAGIRTPTFFGYIFKYSLPVLLPILLLGGWIFLS
ncbi:MAG: sodium:proton antiporter [Opitutaceae bacterium]|jgi:Na+/H+ antiporter NhaD/arsenite permease-like protein|nr:sodium:proton antiporter [Opitutaceae bacterium]